MLLTAFALDHKIAGQVEPILYQVENFIWFTIELCLFYVLIRALPRSSHNLALFGAALYGFHPLAAETLNYALQRGMILSSVGVIGGLLVWIAWPRLLPVDFLILTPRVPKNDWDMFRIKMRPRISAVYRFFRGFPFPFYLIPVVLGMLAGPAALAFPLLLLAYICLFEGGAGKLRVVPSAAVCTVIWLGQSAVIGTHAGQALVPSLAYWSTQPWVVIRYLFAFFVTFPVRGVDGYLPFEHVWSPLALAGYAGLAALVWLARLISREPKWKLMAFGLWWFLASLVPFVLMPQRQPEAFSRAFLAMAGLVIIVVGAVSLLLGRVEVTAPGRLFVQFGTPVLAGAVLLACGVVTNERNKFWVTDEALWGDAVNHNPKDGYAVMNYGLTFMSSGAADVFGVRYSLGYDYLQRALKLLPNNAELETELGIACQQVGLEKDAEGHFRKAIASAAPPARAWSGYADWLFRHGKTEEAFKMAAKAQSLDSSDIGARKILMEINVQNYKWPAALQSANNVLTLDPEDADAQRGRNVALAGIAAVTSTVKLAKEEPSVDHFLKLSALYFQDGRFEDSIEACKSALKLQPDLAEAYANMAASYHTIGKTDEAIAALREAFRLQPDLDVVKNNLQYELAQKNGVR